MKHKNIAYHTRSTADDSRIVGGSFGGDFSLGTVERLVKSHFTVIVKPSGTPVFVDKQGREVRVYFAVDPRDTTMGKVAMETHRKEKARLLAIQEQEEAEQQNQIDDLMDGLSNEEIIRRLSGK
jgi:hypothetical protein